MDKGIYTAVGSINAQRMQETNAIHELANVSTVGFKKAYQIALAVLSSGRGWLQNSLFGGKRS